MKYRILLGVLTLSFLGSQAQVPEDVLKFSWNGPYGTARSQAIGGAMGSLGGDLSAMYVNPAGLGFYKTNEFVITPGFNFLKNNSLFRGTSLDDKGNSFNLGTSGFVFGINTPQSSWKSKAFGLSVTRTANFNSHINYKGQNNFSSFGEQYAAEAAASGLALDNILNSNSVSLQTRMAVYSYLIDTLSVPGNTGKDVVSMALWNNLKNNKAFLVDQQNSIQTKGGITELAIGFAANMDDKIYIGGSFGLPIVNYEKESTLRESDATNDPNNNFGFSELKERFTTKGIGVNLKLGVILKPVEQVRVGLAIHSPTIYGLKDTYEGTMTTNTENYPPSPGLVTVSSGTFTGTAAPTYKYDYTNPWRVLVSGSYVLREVSDVTKQRGFLTADIEYVNYKSNKYTTAEENGDNSYYEGVNDAIKDYYKGAFNFRVGGELKFTTIMARLGFSYYGSPYKDKEIKSRKMYLSGGLGYRNKGFFVDLTYIHGLNRDVNFPYRLSDKANTFAAVNSTLSNVGLTFGLKF